MASRRISAHAEEKQKPFCTRSSCGRASLTPRERPAGTTLDFTLSPPGASTSRWRTPGGQAVGDGPRRTVMDAGAHDLAMVTLLWHRGAGGTATAA